MSGIEMLLVCVSLELGVITFVLGLAIEYLEDIRDLLKEKR